MAGFTIANRNPALKHEGNVLGPNGHQFWEVKIWWFLAIFSIENHISHAFFEVKFWPFFAGSAPANHNMSLKHEGNVLGPNGHQFWEVKIWWFLAIFISHAFFEVKFWPFLAGSAPANPNSTDRSNYWKNYAIQKFSIKFLKVFTIVLQKNKIVFLMVFPIVILHQIHQKKVSFWKFRQNWVRIWTW